MLVNIETVGGVGDELCKVSLDDCVVGDSFESSVVAGEPVVETFVPVGRLQRRYDKFL